MVIRAVRSPHADLASKVAASPFQSSSTNRIQREPMNKRQGQVSVVSILTWRSIVARWKKRWAMPSPFMIRLPHLTRWSMQRAYKVLVVLISLLLLQARVMRSRPYLTRCHLSPQGLVGVLRLTHHPPRRPSILSPTDNRADRRSTRRRYPMVMPRLITWKRWLKTGKRIIHTTLVC